MHSDTPPKCAHRVPHADQGFVARGLRGVQVQFMDEAPLGASHLLAPRVEEMGVPRAFGFCSVEGMTLTQSDIELPPWTETIDSP